MRRRPVRATRSTGTGRGLCQPDPLRHRGQPDAYARSFNDIVSGNNDDFGSTTASSFRRRAGFDMASGLGSPQLTTPIGGNALAFYMCDYSGHHAPVTLTGLSPSSGSTAGVYQVTVSGTGFGTTGSPNVASVQVGTAHATDVSVTSNTELTARFPSAAMTTPPGSPSPEDGAGPATVGRDVEERGVERPERGVGVQVCGRELDTVADPERDERWPLRRVGIGAGAGHDLRLGFTGATKVSFGGVTMPAGALHHQDAVRDHASPRLVYYEADIVRGAADNWRVQKACTQVRTPATTSARCRSWSPTPTARSTTSTILPPYEGALNFDSMGAPTVPAGTKEATAARREFDYVPRPTVTSVSTGTVADLKHCVSPPSAKCNAGLLASEFGGLPANLITVEGTGMNRPDPRIRHLGLAHQRDLRLLPGRGDRDIHGV